VIVESFIINLIIDLEQFALITKFCDRFLCENSLMKMLLVHLVLVYRECWLLQLQLLMELLMQLENCSNWDNICVQWLERNVFLLKWNHIPVIFSAKQEELNAFFYFDLIRNFVIRSSIKQNFHLNKRFHSRMFNLNNFKRKQTKFWIILFKY